MKTYHSSKTMWLGNAIIVFGLVQAALPEFQQYLPHVPEQAWGLATVALGLLVKILRAVTVEPVQTLLGPARVPPGGDPKNPTD